MFFFVLLRAWGKEKKLGPYKEYKESNLGESEFFSLSYANDETKNGIDTGEWQTLPLPSL